MPAPPPDPLVLRLGELLQDYHARHPERQETILRFREFLASGEVLQGKSNPLRHITASTWIVSPDRTRVLLVHHRKLDMWLQPGGHTDPGEDWLAAALREAQEETGLACTPASGKLFDLDIHVIPGRQDTPGHLHYDIRFLVEADPGSGLVLSEESHGIQWIMADDLETLTTEESQLRMRDLAATEG